MVGGPQMMAMMGKGGPQMMGKGAPQVLRAAAMQRSPLLTESKSLTNCQVLQLVSQQKYQLSKSCKAEAMKIFVAEDVLQVLLHRAASVAIIEQSSLMGSVVVLSPNIHTGVHLDFQGVLLCVV
eukprot:2866815-Amphidinium_carterae.1